MTMFEFESHISARRAAYCGFVAAVILLGISVYLVLKTITVSGIDPSRNWAGFAAIITVLGLQCAAIVGLYHFSRIVAVGSCVIFLTLAVAVFWVDGIQSPAVSIAVIVLLLAFIQGIRGTFAYQQGPVSAQSNVGVRFELGVAAYHRGAYRTALREFKALAKQGDASAQYNIGLMYAKGQAVPNDYRKAAKWYRKAAVQGEARAQLNLGAMHSNGRAVPCNCKLAYMWYSVSAAQGNNIAARNIDLMKKRMTSAQVAKAQAMAVKWKP